MTPGEKRKAFYTADEIAELLGFHPETVREWIRKAILPAIKIRGRYRISRKDLEKFLEERKVKQENNRQ